jgi:DNA polymerase-3 subunit gamma/tau
MAVLYRKYRPQTFSEVLSQKPVVQTLKNQISAGSVAHAYLFTGSRGVGKTSVARILAKAVNCLNPKDGDACGVCENCKAIAAGNFLDLVEVDAASNTGVDNIRELIEHVKFSPSSGKYKVFIIDEVHMLSKGAFNALLKTLEEPPAHAIFILATTEINKVPATIVSRTQRFDFKAYSEADLLELLQKIAGEEKASFAPGVLELVSQAAQGGARDALSLLDKVMTLGEGAPLEDCRQLLGVTDAKICEELMELIVLGQASSLPDFFSGLSQKGTDYLILNRDFLEFLRKVLVYKASEGKVAGANAAIGQLADKFSVSELIFITRLFLKSYKDFPSSPLAEVPMLLAGLEAALKRSGGSLSANQLVSKSAAAAAENKESPSAPVVTMRVSEMQDTVLVVQGEDSRVQEATISLQEVEAAWPKVLDKIKKVNGPLASMARAAKLESVEGGRLILGVKFLFDKQNLENFKNSSLICAVLEEVCGQRIGITGRVVKEEKADALGTAEVLSEALKVFGGELIE